MLKSRILIVEDEPAMLRLVSAILQSEGHECLEAVDGQTCLTLAFANHPDLILLDRGLPDMDGMEVMARLRAHYVTNHIPIVMVTARGTMEERLEGLGAGADDYVAKPFDRRELLARVQAVLRRTQRSLEADPLSKLPGNAVIRAHLEKRLETGRAQSVAYVDLDNFKAYVDRYGFEAAGRVIRKTAQTIYNTVVELGDPEDFIGHIGGDDFLILCSPTAVEVVCGELIRAFDAVIPGFYRDEDRERGYIDGRDRYGTRRRFPMVSLSVAIVDIAEGDAPSTVELAEFAARCKNLVKRAGGRGWMRYRYGAM